MRNHITDMQAARRQLLSDGDVWSLIQSLAVDNDVQHFQTKLLLPPVKGQEERWVEQIKGYKLSRDKYRDVIKRACYVAELFAPEYRHWMVWFSTSGGENKKSLEHNLYDVEETILSDWKKDFTDFEKISKMVEEFKANEKFNELRANTIIKTCEERIASVETFNNFHSALYNRQPRYIQERTKWEGFKSVVENIVKAHKDKAEKEIKDAEEQAQAEYKAMIEEEERRREEEEKRKADPWDLQNLQQDDDPFADLHVEKVTF
eukprot:TRINITY_DN4557_c0_g1_i1.p1 TRINITY_DN4557_c0_g1~~TRINITY_DN4557_c0_g1_i1.p1  ORF type:complete len:262 (+),score=63.19 TRINITY_DN4557_c0_g1_i1:84-869(+)